MSSEPSAISVSNVSKRFELYSRPREQLKQFILPRLRRAARLAPRHYFTEFWALRDVSLEIAKGESCGIVGFNGSGKSTLLQIISGTLSPTVGTVATEGRLSALLELGSGFSPDYTGRENVYMNGALQGFSRQQIDEKISEIERFADIGEYFDQPLTNYSSGMQMRVAFAVATTFDPDILIIDEALAVGDAYFQQKCFRRLEEFKQRGGTALFVSHDANAIKQLCNRAILVSSGQVAGYGSPREILDLYQGLIAQKSDLSESAVRITHQSEGLQWHKATTVTTNGDAELLKIEFLDCDRKPIRYLESETDLTVRYSVRLLKDFERPAFGLIIRDRLGKSIFETSTYALRLPEKPIPCGTEVIVEFTMNFNLRSGMYSFSVGVANKGFGRSEFEEYSLLMHDVEQLEVVESPTPHFYGGIFNMKPSVAVIVADEIDRSTPPVSLAAKLDTVLNNVREQTERQLHFESLLSKRQFSSHDLAALNPHFQRNFLPNDDAAIQKNIIAVWKLNPATLLSPQDLQQSGFRVFSQNDEDGILLRLFTQIGCSNRYVIEIGSNCSGSELGIPENLSTNLIVNHGWHGAIFEMDLEEIDKTRYFFAREHATRHYHWENNGTNSYFSPAIVQATVDAANINELLLDANVGPEPDLLILDIDGGDFAVMAAISVVKPRVLVVEFEKRFRDRYRVVQPERKNFNRYWQQSGAASLPAWEFLLNGRGYDLVAIGGCGFNAFFVRSDLVRGRLLPCTARQAFDDHPIFSSIDEKLWLTPDETWLEPQVSEIDFKHTAGDAQ